MKQYVILSHARWSSAPSRIQQLASRLNDAEILYFQPAEHHRDTSWKEGGKQVRPNLTLYTLPPDGLLHQKLYFAEHRSVKKQAAFIEKQVRRQGFRNYVLWLTSPNQVLFLDDLQYRSLVYDCDRFWPPTLDSRESELAYAADVVFAASPLLKQRLSPCSANVALIPNGVNFPMFSRASHPLPDDLAGLSTPILGFVGTIDAALDLSPVQTAAAVHPEWNFVLVGPVQNCPAVQRLSALPNVFFLGERSIADLPDYLGNFQVLLHLRKKGDAESDVIPIRLYEYLSTGHPIVSLLLPDEVEEFPDVIYSAHNSTEFVLLCEKALQENPEWVSPRRRDYGAGASWTSRTETIQQILNAIAL